MAMKQSSPKNTPMVSAPDACERTFSRSFCGSGRPALASAAASAIGVISGRTLARGRRCW